MKRDKDGNLVSIPSNQRPNKDGFREAMNQVLAHELRHYWQHQTGVYYKHPYDTNIPHDERWAEIDANDYMKNIPSRFNINPSLNVEYETVNRITSDGK